MRSRGGRLHLRRESPTGAQLDPPCPPPAQQQFQHQRLRSKRRVAGPTTHSTPTPSRKAAWPGLRCRVAGGPLEDGARPSPHRYHGWGGLHGGGEPHKQPAVQYPFLMQSADGMLHLAYAPIPGRGSSISGSASRTSRTPTGTLGLYQPHPPADIRTALQPSMQSGSVLSRLLR